MVKTISTTVSFKNRYALINYIEIIKYYKLPFYKRWFKDVPTKQLIEI
jgi:hypothetical protein